MSVLFEAGNIAFKNGRYPKAIDLYAKAKKAQWALHHHKRFIIDILIVKSLYHNKQYTEAQEILSKLRKVAPEFWQIYFHEAQIYYLSGDISKALAVLNAYLELNPKKIEIIKAIKELRAKVALK